MQGKSELAPKLVKALKAAIEESGLPEMQRGRLLEELAFLKWTLQDLAESRLDNKDLRSKKAALEGALRNCQEKLTRSERRPSE